MITRGEIVYRFKTPTPECPNSNADTFMEVLIGG
ncbi:hypothetical protein AWB65_04011 [Caballeronia humi]|uniref:Uncharacterized protein n=1 Tax=Caballeronia humi TaxID=326474 RepID=A0A158I009_9BURK|nr:hypothetical protein AWB65_04011 [Caballeronia humi]